MTPREKVESCAAIARSTTHPAEREAAWGRVRSLCRKHGLDPADFDGGPRQAAAARATSHFQTAVANAAVAMRAFAQRMADVAAFSAACQEAAARDAAHVAATELRTFGIYVHRLAPNEWLVPGSGDVLVEIVTDDQLVEWVKSVVPQDAEAAAA